MKLTDYLKIIGSFCVMLLICCDVMAVKANSWPATIIQKDGKPLTVMVNGDEHIHYVTTTDGILLFQDGTDYYIAQIDSQGELRPSPYLAHNAGQRTAEELTAITQQQRQLFYRTHQQRVAQKAETITPEVDDYFPHTGSPRAVVILAEFSDVKFKHDSLTTHEIFDLFLNGEGKIEHEAEPSLALNHGSVVQYFNDMSYGAFTPQFDVYGPVVVPGTMSSYGNSENVTKLMKDALAGLDPTTDLSQYDSNHDGVADLVYIIYAGYGENYSGNSSSCIWPKAGKMSGVSFNGIEISRYGVHCEMGGQSGVSNNINGIGLFCHEFSHTLGLPDLYTNATPADDLGMEDWDLMDGGEYLGNNIGCVPCEYSAWEREVMGWRMMQTLTEKGEYELKQLSEEDGVGFRIDFEGRDHEYIYLQNVQKNGWNTYARWHGMLVTHVRYNTQYVSSGDHPNNSSLSYKRVTLIPADGNLYSQARVAREISNDPDNKNTYTNAYLASYRADPFPGTMNVKALTDETEVRPVTFDDEEPLGKPIFDIQERSSIITFTFIEKVIPTGIDTNDKEKAKQKQAVFDLQGRLLAPSMKHFSPSKGIYIIGNKIHIIQ